jgi:putative transposase
MKQRFSEEQIIRVLKEAEAVGSVREACRKHNITEQTFFRWRKKFGGMEVSEAKRLRNLERENAELKKVVAELTLDNRMLREVALKNW